MSRKAKAKRQRKGRGKRTRQRAGKVQRKHRASRRSVPHKRKAARTRRKPKRSGRRAKPDPRLEFAVREMNRGRSLSATARALGLSSPRLQNHLKLKRLIKRKGKRWIAQDDRLRRVPVMSGGRSRIVTVRGFKAASLIGSHHHAAGQFVRTNDIELIKPFTGQTVQAANGRRYPLETDPNELHRIAAMDTPPFHEIYAITSIT